MVSYTLTIKHRYELISDNVNMFLEDSAIAYRYKCRSEAFYDDIEFAKEVETFSLLLLMFNVYNFNCILFNYDFILTSSLTRMIDFP